ncbi:FLICE-associated huge protein [Xylocopa sonorina]|uniref:FLICE-associated huge protein n=1 Tax=Xylocopa sonorina TaxID=1818115 RepID=UPI00403B1231
MEDDIDIYEDLPSFGTEQSGNFATNNQENIVEEELKLKKQIADLTEKLENLQKINQSLEINLHSLLKTAKAEIARKDKMIDELRKNLDDIAFKRSKTDDSVIHKSTNRETTLNRNQKLANISFASDVNDAEPLVIDSLCNHASKNQPNKSTLMPITVFGERLVKRIAEEQNLEKEEKQSSEFAGGNNNSETNDGYIVESDKENGSLNSTINICNAKQIKSPVSLGHKGGEHTKCPLLVSTITTKDIQFNSKSETGSKLQRKSVLTITYTGKRANEETDGHIPTKQFKSSHEKYSSELLRKDTNINFESEGKSLLTNERVNERHPLRNSDTVCTRNSGTELKKHEHHLNDTNTKEGTKDLKNKNNVSRDRKDTNRRSPKRCNNSTVQNLLKFTLDERYVGYRCSDVFKKGDYQSNHNEYYRSRRREHHRTDDHRPSRVKSTSHVKSTREERYSRSQYNKHSNHEEKFEKHYNFRNIYSKDKLKHFKKDLYNVRSVIKHSTTDRISTSENVANAKKSNGHNEYESNTRKVRLKSTEKPIFPAKWETKQNESFEYTHSKPSTGNFAEHQKYSEFSKHIGKTDDQVVGQIDRIAQTEKELRVHDQLPLTKYVKDELENGSIDLEDGEISSPTENVHDPYQESKDHQVTLRRELNFSSTSSKHNIVEPDTNLGNGSNKPFDTVSQTVSVSTITNVTSVSANRTSSANTETIESIENVENIEKFIRDYGFNNDKTIQEVLVTSDTICVLNNSSANASIGKENEEDGRSREKNSSDSHLSVNRNGNDTVSLDENHQTNIKFLSISGEKSVKNRISTVRISQDNSLQDARLEPNNRRNSKRIGLNPIKLTKHDHLSSKINSSDCEKSVSVTINAMREKERCQRVTKQVEKVEDFRKPLENRSDKNTKVTSANIQGKIVVFARRKKPVCLTNSDANMIVVVNNRTDTSCNSSNTNSATECDSVLKFVKTCGYHTTNAS